MKISGIHIQHFRGIPSTCSLAFVDRNNKACSTIIYGGNGKGKSSIVDAIEYNLQGKIERSSELNNPQRPSVFNFAASDKCTPAIKVIFDDGSEYERKINISLEEAVDTIPQYTPSNIELHSHFQNAPIVLRRNDITLYNNTPKNARQDVIIQFIYNRVFLKEERDNSTLDSLRNQYLLLRKERDKLLNELAVKIKVDTDILTRYYEENKDTIEVYVRQRFSPIGQKLALKKSGVPKKHLPEKTFNDIVRLASQIDSLKNRVREIRRRIKIEDNNAKFKDVSSLFNKDISRYLSAAFTKITNIDYIKEINVLIATSSKASFDIEITLCNGQKVSPNQIFSEANYDLMVLLLYLSIIRVGVDNGQEKLLIIDDVLQSVDANIRVKFIDYILKELSDWQFIITCHDRLWLNQLRELFKLKNHTYKEFNISSWSFETGPIVKETNRQTLDETLRQAINTSNTRIIASMAGVFLERICHELSISLRGSIERKPDDKYTIGDLWPTVLKHLKQTSLKEIVEDIDNFKHVRNLLGAHYNEWADMMSDDEVLHFAHLVQKLYEKTFCSNCMKWISRNGKKDYYCHCRSIQY